MTPDVEIYQIGGVTNTLELIYKIHYLRKEGYNINVRSYDPNNDEIFYVNVSKDGSKYLDIKVALRSTEKTKRAGSTIDEHFIYTDMPTRLSKEINYTDFVNLTNIYSRLCAYNTLFLLLGRDVYDHYRRYNSMLYTVTSYMTNQTTVEMIKKFFIGDDENMVNTYFSLIEGFSIAIKQTVEKLDNCLDKNVPGKGRSKALIYHTVLANVMSMFIAVVNEPHKNFNMKSWNPSSLITSVINKEINNQIKYVTLESFILCKYLTQNMVLLTGISEKSTYYPFFSRLIELGDEAEKASGLDESYGIMIDGNLTNFEYIDKVILKTRAKMEYDVEKSKFCFRCSKHYSNYLFGYYGMQTGGDSSVRESNLLDFYADHFSKIISEKDNDVKEYIVSSIINKILLIAYESNPYKVCEKSIERLISYSAILTKMSLKGTNSAIDSKILLGRAYADMVICYLINMWVFNKQTSCLQCPKQRKRLAMMTNYYVLFNASLTSDMKEDEKDAIIRTAEENISLIYESSVAKNDRLGTYRLNPVRYPETTTPCGYLSINGMYTTLMCGDYDSMRLYRDIEKNVKDKNPEDSILDKLKKSVNVNNYSKDEDFELVALDKNSKLNYIIYKRISEIYRSTNFNYDEKAFIIFCCLTKLLMKCDCEMKKLNSSSKESMNEIFGNTYDFLKRDKKSSNKFTLQSLFRSY